VKKREVEVLRQRAIRSLCTYAEPSARVWVRAADLKAVCEEALLHFQPTEQLRMEL
jgi:hypothetical protein